MRVLGIRACQRSKCVVGVVMSRDVRPVQSFLARTLSGLYDRFFRLGSGVAPLIVSHPEPPPESRTQKLVAEAAKPATPSRLGWNSLG